MRVGAVAVSRHFRNFTVLGVVAGLPSLAYEATGPIGQSFKRLKAWDSTLVESAKVVLPVSHLICCFKIPSFFPTNPAACGF